MTKSAGIEPDAANDDVSVSVSVSQSWGTWEELLLAFAVNRHGIGEWDSIAAELQKRSSDPTLPLTAQNCRLKYLDLRRRFGNEDPVDGGGVRDDKSGDEDTVPLLEELRKLRVAELRREVERYDLNIESLELKMKRMEEEREKASRKEKTEPDPEMKVEDDPRSEPGSEPIHGVEPVTGEDSEKDHMSVNESNSTDLVPEKLKTAENDAEPDRTGQTAEEPAELKPEPDGKPVREDSCNGSSNSIEKGPNRKKAKAEAVSNSAELVDSEAESKGGGAAPMKENSDVQSSVSSRSREEKEGSDKVRRGSTSGDERDHEDQSRTVKELSAESQRLIEFLQRIRSHKLGSVFERRLRSQESSKYQKLILQHVDLETIESRLKEGWYSSSTAKFFRDILLLVNNALVFFNKNSSEAKAATEIRRLITSEMSQKHAKSESSSGKHVSLQSLSMPKTDDPDSLLLKPRLSGSLIVCRKRSSIASKASAVADKKKEQVTSLEGEKDTKSQRSNGSSEEPKITRKRTRDRFSPVTANAKKNGKNQPKTNSNKTSVEKQSGKGGSSSTHSESKSENKKNQPTVDSKKRGAANFLSRMKQGSSSNSGSLLDALKNTPLTSESGKGGSEKKNDNAKRGEKKETVTRRNSESRQTKEKGSPEKKNVGRPPKRGTAPVPALGKRGRERGEPESGGSKQQPKKRSRKL